MAVHEILRGRLHCARIADISRIDYRFGQIPCKGFKNVPASRDQAQRRALAGIMLRQGPAQSARCAANDDFQWHLDLLPSSRFLREGIAG